MRSSYTVTRMLAPKKEQSSPERGIELKAASTPVAPSPLDDPKLKNPIEPKEASAPSTPSSSSNPELKKPIESKEVSAPLTPSASENPELKAVELASFGPSVNLELEELIIRLERINSTLPAIIREAETMLTSSPLLSEVEADTKKLRQHIADNLSAIKRAQTTLLQKAAENGSTLSKECVQKIKAADSTAIAHISSLTLLNTQLKNFPENLLKKRLHQLHNKLMDQIDEEILFYSEKQNRQWGNFLARMNESLSETLKEIFNKVIVRFEQEMMPFGHDISYDKRREIFDKSTLEKSTLDLIFETLTIIHELITANKRDASIDKHLSFASSWSTGYLKGDIKTLSAAIDKLREKNDKLRKIEREVKKIFLLCHMMKKNNLPKHEIRGRIGNISDKYQLRKREASFWLGEIKSIQDRICFALPGTIQKIVKPNQKEVGKREIENTALVTSIEALLKPLISFAKYSEEKFPEVSEDAEYDIFLSIRNTLCFPHYRDNNDMLLKITLAIGIDNCDFVYGILFRAARAEKISLQDALYVMRTAHLPEQEIIRSAIENGWTQEQVAKKPLPVEQMFVSTMNGNGGGAVNPSPSPAAANHDGQGPQQDCATRPVLLVGDAVRLVVPR